MSTRVMTDAPGRAQGTLAAEMKADAASATRALVSAGQAAVKAAPVSAAERLEMSRRLLRLTMRRNAGLEPPTARSQGHRGPMRWLSELFDKVKTIPGADAVTDVLRGWWFNHPLRTAALVAQNATRSVVTPYAKSNPLLLVAGAMLGGVLLMRIRPWRLLPKSLLFAGLLPRIATRVAASVPVDSWLNALSAFGKAPSKRQ